VNGRPALFLDRDGVINVDHGYVSKRENFDFVPGIFDVCRAARRLGHAIFVVTNQAGIGRGYYSEEDFHTLTKWMCNVFESQDATIDKVYFCPTHPQHGVGHYKVESDLRKPGPGMILQARREFGIALGRSMLIGDNLSDIAAGRAAGVACNCLLVSRPGDGDEPAVPCTRIVRLVDAIPLLAELRDFR
jgi:D-glycero-D-manno-heptose 1,7-bisphosphate phosphatase